MSMKTTQTAIPKRPSVALIAVLAAVSIVTLSGGPNRFGHSDRVERHMLPEVSTGPQEPSWSPDGKWIAFSMRGDIWKVPADGGEAIALTKGPAYHFEPAWSPDGSRIALSMDIEGNLDIGVVSADGGDVVRLTTDRRVDVEPAWSRDGSSLYFVSARGGNFDIYRYTFADRTETPFISGPRDQIQPSESPDGTRLAYVSPVEGRLGTGGIWVKPLAGGDAALVRYEETEYRARPAWTPDNQMILYSSDEPGSNDIAIVPAAGGNPVYLTVDGMNEFAPAVAPDGTRFAFLSNRTGPTTLFTAALGGGPFASWTEVPIKSRKSRTPTARVRGRVAGADGKPTAARIYPLASDGRAYTPDGGFHRVIAATETHYFHTTGTFELEVPAGELSIEAMKGFEYRPDIKKLNVAAGSVSDVTLRLERLVDAPARGWYSGDTHVHDLHQGRFGLSHQLFFDQLRAEDLHVTNALIHMDGTRLMGRWADLTGKPHPLSTPEYILQYSEEFRGSLGHIALIGINKYVLPFTAGNPNTAYAQPELDAKYLDGARAQGGIAGYVHPYNNNSKQPSGYAGSLIPVNIALGKGDFYDIGALVSDEVASAEFYYRLLNCGFRIAATSGTDNFSDVWRDPPPGADRAYVRARGSLSLGSWMEGIKNQRTFGTTGPLLFLEVEGREPGEEIALGANEQRPLLVKADAVSIAPLERLEIIVNGRVVQTATPSGDASKITYSGPIELPEGGWIAARVAGPKSRYVTDSYAFAQTSAVYVTRGGKRFTSPEDAKFLADVVDALWARVDGQRARWRSPAERERFKNSIDRAREVYLKIAGSGTK
jgi:TolB protein